jgi:hypothetical protein
MKSALLLSLLILAQVTASADGGALRFRKEAGGLVITVFASPSPLSVGPADISVLLQNRDGLAPVLDANVELILRDDASGIEFQAHPTRAQEPNSLLYSALVMFSKPGKWQIAVSAERNRKESFAAGILEVTPAQDRKVSYAGISALPPVMIALVLGTALMSYGAAALRKWYVSGCEQIEKLAFGAWLSLTGFAELWFETNAFAALLVFLMLASYLLLSALVIQRSQA